MNPREAHTSLQRAEGRPREPREAHPRLHLAMFSRQHQGAEALAKIPERDKGLAEVRTC